MLEYVGNTIEFQELSCTKIVSIEACGYYINQV